MRRVRNEKSIAFFKFGQKGMMTKGDRFSGCIIGGAIGDALGSGYENLPKEDETLFYPFGKPKKKIPTWQITDDTQLTLATCEAIIESEQINPEILANWLLKYYKQKRIYGIGSSTLKAMKELNIGGHWSQVGRRGEYAAGNGAAMRIAPIAFCKEINREDIRDYCIITHNNDEAYTGALCIILTIRAILNGEWTGKENLLSLIITQIPDTSVRDRLIEINEIQERIELQEIGKLGNNGYVVNSIPLALAAANKFSEIGMEQMFTALIDIGGDTDTNCSLAGQLIGTLKGIDAIPEILFNQLKQLPEYNKLEQIITKLKIQRNWHQ